MEESSILRDFLSLNSTGEIAKKYNLRKGDVKLLLRNSLPFKYYIKLAHKAGAKSVREKLCKAGFRRQYLKKMKNSVSTALHRKLKNKIFRERWHKKARLASIQGNQKIKELLSKPDFSASWSQKCRVGGLMVKLNKMGIFDPARKSDRIRWSMLGLSRTARKTSGPLGERMYNHLESRVAEIILSSQFTYHYGKIVRVDNMNGFFSIDFVVKEVPLVIEVTYWDKIEEKCEELERKFMFLRRVFPTHTFLVITKPSMRDHYKRLLPDNINVLTPNQFEQYIAGFHFSK